MPRFKGFAIAADDGGSSKLQFIMSLDMAEYRLKCAKYGVHADESRPAKSARR